MYTNREKKMVNYGKITHDENRSCFGGFPRYLKCQNTLVQRNCVHKIFADQKEL